MQNLIYGFVWKDTKLLTKLIFNALVGVSGNM